MERAIETFQKEQNETDTNADNNNDDSKYHDDL